MDVTSVDRIGGYIPKEPPPRPTVEDPKLFFDGFRNSTWYKNAYERRLREKTPEVIASEEEKRKVFEQQEEAKSALLSYAQKDVAFHYNPDYYSPEAKEAIETYVDHVKDIIKMYRGGISQDQLINLDTQRSTYHQQATRLLEQENIVPKGLGKTFVRLILIEKKLDTYENAAIPDFERVKRMLGME